MTTPAIEVLPPDPPRPVVAGTFAVYAHPDGGYVLVTEIAGRGTETKHIPGAIVKIFNGYGPVGKMITRMMGAT